MKKIGILGILFLILLFSGVSQSKAQSTCNCSTDGVCSSSQSCPSGFIAMCTCTAASCGSSCQKAPADENGLTAAFPSRSEKELRLLSTAEIGPTLSKA